MTDDDDDTTPYLRAALERAADQRARAALARGFLAEPAPPPPPIDPSRPIGGWQPAEELARGAGGRVFRSRRLTDGLIGAQKVLAAPDEDLDGYRLRLLAEIRALSTLLHRHIIRVLDHGEHQGRPFIVFELAEGGTLRARMTGPIDPRLAIAWLVQVCWGLGFAHDRGFLHRDVKPENLLFMRPRSDYLVVADFGLVKPPAALHEDTVTRTNEIWGTPGYLAPERLRAEPPTAAVDVYACGVLLFELLTGVEPEWSQGSYVMPRLPGRLGDIIARAVADDPADRFVNCNELADALERVGRSLIQT